MDAGQPDTDNVNSTLTLIAGRARGEEGNRENRENRVANNIDEKKYGDGKPNVNVTTNPLDISLIGARTDRSNNGQSSDGPGRTSATNKPRGKPAGKSKLFIEFDDNNAYPLLFHIFDQFRVSSMYLSISRWMIYAYSFMSFVNMDQL